MKRVESMKKAERQSCYFPETARRTGNGSELSIRLIFLMQREASLPPSLPPLLLKRSFTFICPRGHNGKCIVRDALPERKRVIQFQDISNLITNSNRNYHAHTFLTALMDNRNSAI